ncbi:hypothetical protein CPB84DRAFT_1744666 [Gymnopilus junonius]|uniref:PH domain-containing protein n=1 Tax=Gymnopilus junonius TaxID=109634 RepID=A0A9P5TS99_GYMJU|nr:hypothetical protein CPB84DRAFT_1744666 [Gymnopilus junonius]
MNVVQPAPPPTPQEIQRKLSVHSVSREKSGRLTKDMVLRVQTNYALGPVSGTESDSDSVQMQDVYASTSQGGHGSYVGPSTSQPPLSSIAERRSDSGEDTDDDDLAEGGWKTADVQLSKPRSSVDESAIKAGYLWKKGERRKTWKKRWFVLRPHHIAYYKTSAEYQLLRLLELSDVHSCTQVNLKRHENTFGLISPTRTYYLQASSPDEVQSWVKAIEEAREALLATSTQNSAATPIPIPKSNAARSTSRGSVVPPPSSSPGMAAYGHAVTSSDSEGDAAVSPTQPTFAISPPRGALSQKEPGKVILSGYLMKCGSKRRNWRKRWFVLTTDKLVYSGSHMDTKPHRQFPFNDILDALEYDLPLHKSGTSGPSSPPHGLGGDGDDAHSQNTFKIVTTKRTLLLCAPSEDDEIKWLGAIRALITRRAEAGQVPGKASKSPSSGYSGHEGSGGAGGSGLSGNAPASGSGSSGMKGKVRRLSTAGSTGEARAS